MEYTYLFEIVSEDADYKIYELRLLGDGIELGRAGQISIGQDLDEVSADNLLYKFETEHFVTLRTEDETYQAAVIAEALAQAENP